MGYYDRVKNNKSPATARNLTKKRFPPLEYVAVKESGKEKVIDAIPVDDKEELDSAYDKFCSAGDGDQREAIAWVGNSLEFEDRVTVKDAPSALAWNLYKWVSKGEDNKADFWKSIWPKVLPTKAQIDKDDRFAYGSDHVLKLIDRVITAARVAKEEQ